MARNVFNDFFSWLKSNNFFRHVQAFKSEAITCDSKKRALRENHFERVLANVSFYYWPVGKSLLLLVSSGFKNSHRNQSWSCFMWKCAARLIFFDKTRRSKTTTEENDKLQNFQAYQFLLTGYHLWKNPRKSLPSVRKMRKLLSKTGILYITLGTK